ncbi:hypothetical protein K450DRAFT_245306 [Umbelopsis ramanniana AG]|uniref:Uncharacterized protein n=1 Tax=Umbelopsis ramanniana AG TaxID=1314678 RepID=A0AAD5HC63_UMBRA|nr:uncharacterized protein K450DRAFT_245306 [Umbelopsis ramanniana AG]KAI8578747.1 hypothetical protein K450DRAFT_245306 [Umbelopsis ramanniana AG]
MRREGSASGTSNPRGEAKLEDRGHSHRITCCWPAFWVVCLVLLVKKKKKRIELNGLNLPLHLPCFLFLFSFTPD